MIFVQEYFIFVQEYLIFVQEYFIFVQEYLIKTLQAGFPRCYSHLWWCFLLSWSLLWLEDIPPDSGFRTSPLIRLALFCQKSFKKNKFGFSALSDLKLESKPVFRFSSGKFSVDVDVSCCHWHQCFRWVTFQSNLSFAYIKSQLKFKLTLKANLSGVF